MLEHVRQYLGLQFAKLQFRSDVDVPQPLTSFLSGARNVLIILPQGYDDAHHAGNALRRYRDQLHHLHLTIVHSSTRTTALSEFLHSEVIRLSPSDVNRFSLPSRVLLRRIFQREYDVAMDFNLDFVLHTAYICKASRAKVRVGCQANSVADIFFNVHLNFDLQGPPQARYEKLAACLAMF